MHEVEYCSDQKRKSHGGGIHKTFKLFDEEVCRKIIPDNAALSYGTSSLSIYRISKISSQLLAEFRAPLFSSKLSQY